ncbi:MAG: ABC transporter substrate-binding protein, partial [Clostridiaceae bacterium]
MKRKLSLLLAMAISAVILLTGCGSKKAEDTFKVGLEAGYPPFNWTQSDDSNGAVKIEGTSEYAGGYD